MPRSLPPLNALRAFEAAARLQSFTRAAAELNVSHSAISRHVRGLEKRLDVQLFKVAQKGVSLTDLGRRYGTQVTPLLDQIALATEQVSVKPKGKVTLSVEPTFAQKWLVPRLGDFFERYPDVELVLRSSPEVVDVSAHAADIALRYCAQETNVKGFELVSDCPYRVYAKPGLVNVPKGKTLPEILKKHRLIGYYLNRLWPMWFSSVGMENPPQLNLTEHMPALLMIEYAVAGQGVLLLSSEMVEYELRDNKLELLSDVGVPWGGYYLVLNETAQRRKAVRALHDWVLEQSVVLRGGTNDF